MLQTLPSVIDSWQLGPLMSIRLKREKERKKSHHPPGWGGGEVTGKQPYEYTEAVTSTAHADQTEANRPSRTRTKPFGQIQLGNQRPINLLERNSETEIRCDGRTLFQARKPTQLANELWRLTISILCCMEVR